MWADHLNFFWVGLGVGEPSQDMLFWLAINHQIACRAAFTFNNLRRGRVPHTH
jgi:hypothetical protein